MRHDIQLRGRQSVFVPVTTVLHTRRHIEHPSHLVMQVTVVSEAQEKPGYNVKDLTQGHTASKGQGPESGTCSPHSRTHLP